MTHSRVAGTGEAADANGCVSTTFVADGNVGTAGGVMSDAEYDTYYDTQGYPKPGNLLVSASDMGASVVIDIDP